MERKHLLAVALASMLLAVIAAAFIDRPLALWIAAHEQNWVWEPSVRYLEYLAGVSPWHWTVPVIVVVGTLASLAVARWRGQTRAWMYIAVVYLLSRNLMAWGKTLTGRLRPHQWVEVGGSTFGHVGDGVSFPSGHVTVFGGLILPLVVAIPRLRPLIVIVPFIMIARVAVLAHFVSDTCAGLALTSLVAWGCAPILTIGEPHRAPAR